MQQSASLLVKAIERLDLKRCIDLWEAPKDFSVMPTFLLHILYHLSTYHIEYSLYDQAKNIPINHQTSRWRSQLNLIEVCSLLAEDYGACGLKVKASNIHHNSVGCGVFSGRPFNARQIVG